MRSPLGRPGTPIVLDGIRYASQAEASRRTGVPPSTLSKRLAREARRALAPVCPRCGNPIPHPGAPDARDR